MWKSDFFTMGHKLNEIDGMCYWDYIELINGISDLRQLESKGKKGNFSSGSKLTPTHRKMIEESKKSKVK